MEWTEDLSVGVDEIDSQHRELFSRINDLVDAIKHARCKYTIGGTIKFLEDYAVTHFREEERCMLEHHYEGYRQQKAQHELFLRSLSDLKKMLEAPKVEGSFYELSVITNQVVVDWILDHIIKVDKRLGRFLREKNGA
jgi:hemerythrin